MRQNSRQSRHEMTIASQLGARSLSRAAFAIAAIGALAACSADQSLSSSPQSKASSPSQAPSPALVYVSDSSGVQQLWKVAGGVTSRLTFSNSVDKDPHSAAGHLVFASYRDGDEEIYIANNDLSGLKRLTNSSKEDEQPNLSPDGSRIAFVSYRSGTPRLWTMDSTGANQTALTTGSESFVPENGSFVESRRVPACLYLHTVGFVPGFRNFVERRHAGAADQRDERGVQSGLERGRLADILRERRWCAVVARRDGCDG